MRLRRAELRVKMMSSFAILLFLLHNGVSSAGGYVRAWLDTIQYTKLPYQPPWGYNNTGTCETYLQSIRKWRSSIDELSPIGSLKLVATEDKSISVIKNLEVILLLANCCTCNCSIACV